MPLQEHRISSIPLSASARAKALYGVLIRRGRDDLRVVRLNAVAGAPYFIYPAQRHRASARAKAFYGALIPRGRDDLRVVRKLCCPRVDGAAPAAASTVPLTVLSQVSYRQISDLLNLIIHFVHFFLNKAAGCAIHTALVLRHSPDGALLNSSRSGNHFVAFSRLTNGGSAPSDWILFSNGRDDLCILPRGRDDLRVVRLSAHPHSPKAPLPLRRSRFSRSVRLPPRKYFPNSSLPRFYLVP